MLGQRRAKNTLQDLAEAKASIERAIQIKGKSLGRKVDPVRIAKVLHGNPRLGSAHSPCAARRRGSLT